MTKFFSWVWAFVPAPAKMWVIGGAVVLLLGLLGFSVYKIQKWGYDRCQDKHDAAIVDLKDSSREEILKTEKQYDKIRTKIIRIEGDNGIAGPRTQLAIDSLPEPSSR